MESVLLCVGKTDQVEIDRLISDYQKRLSHYIKFSIQFIDDPRNRKSLSKEEQKNWEGKLLKKQLKAGDRIVLLDENGKQYTSTELSKWLNKQMNAGPKRIVFLVGGPYGFSQEIYGLATQKISLSSLTFSHQMVRLFFTEQLYRAHTILNNEPYHHQ